MVEILATCLIAVGTVFTVPDGWTAEQVGARGTPNTCAGIGGRGGITGCVSMVPVGIDMTYVRLRRPIKAGEQVTPPEGCTLEVRREP